jgi:SAM-dependent methyltransferase
MPYASLTRNDRNPLKRFLQRRRMRDALALTGRLGACTTIVDFGAGDGEACKHLAARFPDARIFCYEPCPALREEAKANLRDTPRAVIVGELTAMPRGQCDLVLCMEVFEHLPPEQTEQSLSAIDALLCPEGAALIGVPVEVFLSALAKGAFRMTRRRGDFDARLGNVLRATLGRPPRERPLSEISPGLPYHFYHLGFDHRRLRRQLEAKFKLQGAAGSPLPLVGAWLNSEIYYLVRKAIVGQVSRPACAQHEPSRLIGRLGNLPHVHLPSGVRPSR